MSLMKILNFTLLLALYTTTANAHTVFGGKRESCDTNNCYFVSKGAVYKAKVGERTGYILEQSNSVQFVLAAHGRVYALQTDGDLYLWANKNRVWVSIGKEIKTIKFDGKNLYAIFENGQIGIYGGESFNYTSMSFEGLKTGSVSNLLWNPGVNDVVDIVSENGQTTIVYGDGSREPITQAINPDSSSHAPTVSR